MDLVGVQEVRLEGSGISKSENYAFYLGNTSIRNRVSFHRQISSAVKRVSFFSNLVLRQNIDGVI